MDTVTAVRNRILALCGEREITIKRGKYVWWCKCEGCNAESGVRTKKREAIEAWNRRVSE